jgi:hypothetical protein
MTGRHWPTLACLALALPAAGPAFATCIGQPVPMNWCARCTTQQPVATSRDTPCSGGFGHAGTSIVIMESRVAKQAARGRVQMQGATWTYTPPKGFTGRDTFTIQRSLIKDGQLYVLYTQFAMDVR